jgi:hypothetical protein
VTLSHPVFFAIALALTCGATLRLPKQQTTFWLILIGLIFLATASGGPTITLHLHKNVAVMVDLSPSTRGAAFRDRSALLHRIGELVGNVPVQISAFSDRGEALPEGAILPDLPCDQTRYDQPAADAILLFSDGRFSLPESGAPTYPIIDPLLIDPPDAAVTEMHFDGDIPTAAFRITGGRRILTWFGSLELAPTQAIDHSGIAQSHEPPSNPITASFNRSDLWPENDSLTLPAQASPHLAFWWIGAGPIPGGWQHMDPPSDPTSYLGVGAIALSNVAADRLSETQQQRLMQYVRDLGGTLLIFGGDHAFGAGGYTGTELDSLSPLASEPPAPLTHWILLTDSSGSMADESNGRSRWSSAVDAMLRLLPLLPPKDIVSVGSFARDLSWWTDGQPAATAARSTSPPPDTGPNGPTNLQPVLSELAARTNPLPCEVLLLTDADATIDQPQSLAAALKASKVRVSLLALGNVSPDNPVVRIVNATGGRWIASGDASKWIDSLRSLMRSASPSHLESTKTDVRFDSSLGLPDSSVDAWNHAWMKSNATQLASGTDQATPLAARWQLGLGSVAAFAFTPTPDESSVLANDLSQPPRDPRFKTSWQCDSKTKISVDASDASGYLNGLKFIARFGDQTPQPLVQTGPGSYSLEIPALRTPALATVQLDDHVIDRHAIAGRYAPEFDAIGNDDAALAELAARTSGRVIAPSQHSPIVFHWPSALVRIDSYLAFAGAAFLSAGLITSRSKR